MTADKIPIADYLFQRLAQLGLSHIFGVPGDFNLTLLDHVYVQPDFKWVGFCNELNAAYAADGFGRVKRSPAALITTYGVGELSAINGISGAHAEQVPIIHIVGTTARPIQEKQLLIHHVTPGRGLNPPDHKIYAKVSEPFSCATEYLYDVSTAASQIDRVITEVYKQSLPGYIYIPVDMVNPLVPSNALSVPLPLAPSNEGILTEADEDALVDRILNMLYTAKNPVILADTLAVRHHASELVKELVDKTQMWSFATVLSHGVIDETHPAYVGIYNGLGSHTGIAEAVHGSDLVLNIGPLLTDSNTGGFTRDIKPENAVLLHPLYVQLKDEPLLEGVHFLPVLAKLVERIDPTKLAPRALKPVVTIVEDRPGKSDITLAKIVSNVSDYIQPGDVVVAEVGTVQFASPDLVFKENNEIITQVFYSSIGHALPASVGAAFALRELGGGRRVVLLEGDGSSQMTIQELGTMVRFNLDVTIFLLNNSGYSIERAIWGPDQGYNDICPNWKWTQLLETFGGTEGKTVLSKQVATEKKLREITSDKDGFGKLTIPRLVEVILDAKDYPWRLEQQIEIMGGKNRDMIIEYAATHDV
ncbi:hypothetical protein DV495_004189 [Geotrichum candidum]|uniref:Similar to Saccharomyces cerevisiae YDR380W ARO10 Phenylpyruvate decarboxylase n=1 Tax=Geotrichum candidum TaxID=1173061 RepID=A0A0J9XDE0_GEOCN|nr:hypothetical protein DV452_004583 [Geotrichum candidum]KAI9214793.1 hypothetical protein DS838_000292 [Geotrichum bryndzae]KAF5122748.1 hypothetical protein DV495_004189 [Geotrichum candidum]KAF7497642.1 hypothetical protein DV113_004322 [Geotrichum candidum]KAI8134635.1 hypothetical protein DUD61_001684 [Geotrichum candidum]